MRHGSWCDILLIGQEQGRIGDSGAGVNQYATQLKQVFLYLPGMGAYESAVAKGCAVYALEAGDILLHRTMSLESLGAIYDEIQQYGGDFCGIIVNTADPSVLELAHTYTRHVVNVANAHFAGNRYSVHSDDVAIGRVAGEYLASLGFSNYLYFGFVGSSSFGVDRLTGYRESLRAHGHEAVNVYANLPRMLGEIRAGLPGVGRPAALFSSIDNYSYGFASQLRLFGINVPEEIALLGVDNDEVANALSSYELSTICQDTRAIGYQALKLVDDLASGREARYERRILAPPGEVIKRGSTDVAAVADWLVLRAVRVIRDSAHLPMTVDSLAHTLHTSKRTLQRRFSQLLGNTVQDQIRRAKLSRAENLLRETDMTIEQVAFSCGYDNSRTLRNLFRQFRGMRPGEFRRNERGAASGRPL